MPLKNFLLTLHILGAIAGFGPTFVFPFLDRMSARPGAPVPWILRTAHEIADRYTTPVAATVQPGTGAAMIVISHNPELAPFTHEGRWLLAALIIYTFSFFFALLIERPWAVRSIRLAETGDFGDEFKGLVRKQQIGGMLLGINFLTILVLMVTKPGSHFIHP